MRISGRIILVAAALLSATTAFAHRERCWKPMSDWKSRAEVEAYARSQSWTVEKIRIDDGCYKLIGRDSQGNLIRVYLDPATLEPIDVHGSDDDRTDGHDGEQGDGQSN